MKRAYAREAVRHARAMKRAREKIDDLEYDYDAKSFEKPR